MIEVELKFEVDSLAQLRRQLMEMGATPVGQTVQSDEYLNDPLRNFAKQDLALRIRNCDGKYWLTFKGPKLDPVAKIREEIEMPLVDEVAAEQMRQVYLGIGFVSVAKVVKKREDLKLTKEGRDVLVCLDEVEKVGEFAELELVVANRDQVDAAKRTLFALAKDVGLNASTKTSYLQLLLDRNDSV